MPVRALPSLFDTQVAGVTFAPGYPDTLHSLNAVMFAMQGDEHPVAILQRNPDNAYDTNAIEVHVPALGLGGFVGHIPAHVAAKLAPLLDEGENWAAWVMAVRIAEDHEDRPGITIHLRRFPKESE